MNRLFPGGLGGGGPPGGDAPQVDSSEQVYISSLALLKMLKHGERRFFSRAYCARSAGVRRCSPSARVSFFCLQGGPRLYPACASASGVFTGCARPRLWPKPCRTRVASSCGGQKEEASPFHGTPLASCLPCALRRPFRPHVGCERDTAAQPRRLVSWICRRTLRPGGVAHSTGPRAGNKEGRPCLLAQHHDPHPPLTHTTQHTTHTQHRPGRRAHGGHGPHARRFCG